MSKSPKKFAKQQAQIAIDITKSNARGGVLRGTRATEQTYHQAINEHLQTLKSEANTLATGPLKDAKHHSEAEIASEQNNLRSLSIKFKNDYKYDIDIIPEYGKGTYGYKEHKIASASSGYDELNGFAGLKGSEISAIATREAKDAMGGKVFSMGTAFKVAMLSAGVVALNHVMDGKIMDFAKSAFDKTADTLKSRGGLAEAFKDPADGAMAVLNNVMPSSMSQIVLAGGGLLAAMAISKQVKDTHGGMAAAGVLTAAIAGGTYAMQNLDNEHDVEWKKNPFVGEYVEVGSNLIHGRSVDNPAGPAPGPVQ